MKHSVRPHTFQKATGYEIELKFLKVILAQKFLYSIPNLHYNVNIHS
jgi:hypothetical protein